MYSVTAPTCASVSASASPPSPIAHGAGAHVTFSATASSCSNPNPFYEFWFFNGSSWQMVQGWSTTSTYDWNTTGAPPGTWKFGVWVRDSNSTAIYDAFSPIDYTLT